MSRLGRSLVTDSELLSLDQILAEIEAVDPESVAQLAAMLLAPELSVAGIGTNEERFRAATARVAPHLAEARPRDASPAACPGPGRGRSRRVRRKTRGFPHRGGGVPQTNAIRRGAHGTARPRDVLVPVRPQEARA